MAGTADLGTGRHTRNGARARARAVWLELPSWAQGDTPEMAETGTINWLLCISWVGQSHVICAISATLFDHAI